MKVAVTGYAGLEHVMDVATLPGANETAIVEGMPGRRWPRQGGCAPNIARGLAAAGVETELISWLGADSEGERYLQDLRADGVGTEGVRIMPGRRTASTYLFYAADGGSMCFYDPSGVRSVGLSGRQGEIVAGADWLCVAVGPRRVSEDVLSTIPDDTKLVWAVKADPDAFPPGVVRSLLARSAAVVFSRGERHFLHESVPDTEPLSLVPGDCLVVETRGDEGAAVLRGGDGGVYPVEPVAVPDPTGAGDAFVAGMLASLVRRPEDPGGAVSGGVEASHRFVVERSKERV